MDYQAILRRKKEEERQYRDINDPENFDGSANRGPQSQWNGGQPSYPLRRSRSVELEEKRTGPTPHPFLTPSPHMLVPGYRGDRFRQGSDLDGYQPSFGQASENTLSRSDMYPTVPLETKKTLPWERNRSQITEPFSSTGNAGYQPHCPAQMQMSEGGNWPFNQGTADRSTVSSIQGNARLSYRHQLQNQMEEQRRMKQEQKERDKQEAELLEKRAEEQRLRMQREYDQEEELRKKRQHKLLEKQELLHQKQQELADSTQYMRTKRKGGGKEEREEDVHRGWTPPPKGQVKPEAEKAVAHRGWTPPPPKEQNKAQVQEVHRGWTPPPKGQARTDADMSVAHRGWTPPSKEQNKAQIKEEHRGWTPPPTEQRKTRAQEPYEHREWTASRKPTDQTEKSYSHRVRSPPPYSLNKSPRGWTPPPTDQNKGQIPEETRDKDEQRSSRPCAESRQSWETVDLEPSVLDEIAQLRQRLRSEQMKLIQQKHKCNKRHYRILSHEFFDD